MLGPTNALSTQEIQTLYEWGSGDYTDRSYHDGSDSGAVSRWKFDSSADDAWGSNNGTLKGDASVGNSDSIRNGSASFDGSGDYIDTSLTSLSAPVSVSGWVNITDKSQRRFWFSNHSGSDSDFWLKYNASNDIFQFNADDGSGLGLVDSDTQPVKGAWYHIAGTVNSSGDRKIYVNGNKEGEINASLTTWDTGESYKIGTLTSSKDYWQGKIDDARIYNRALEPYEVFQLYQWGTRGRDMRKLTTNARGDH